MSVCLLSGRGPHLKKTLPRLGIFKLVEYATFKSLICSNCSNFFTKAQTAGKWAVSFRLKCFVFECNCFCAYAWIEKLDNHLLGCVYLKNLKKLWAKNRMCCFYFILSHYSQCLPYHR